MKVSIIITNYNYGRYLERAIRSCLNQSLSRGEFEIIVVDDCSTDESHVVLKNFESEVRIIKNDMNLGLSASRNKGIRSAYGQYVMNLDADDYLDSKCIEILSFYLSRNLFMDAVACDYILVDNAEKHINRKDSMEEPIACGIMFRKDQLLNIGLYDTTFEAREEEDLRLRFLEKYSIHGIHLPLYRYRMHNTNMTKDEVLMKNSLKKLQIKHQEK